MHFSLFIVSIFLLFTVGYDFFFTVISINGAGAISSRLSALISTLFLKMNYALKTRRVLKYSGMSVILSLIIWWIGGLWLGFYILILSDDLSVVTSSNELAADLSEKFYYSGYVLSTMGNGDFKPGTSLWQIVIGIFSFSGFIFITTAMTYLISVSSAVIHKRSLALFITDMMLLDEYENKVKYLYENESTLRNMINRHIQNHLAYPILHYFFSMDKKASFSFGLWELNGLLISIQDNSESLPHKLKPLVQAVDSYLDKMSAAFIPRLQRENETEGVNSDDLRKEQLRHLLISDGWNVKEIDIK